MSSILCPASRNHPSSLRPPPPTFLCKPSAMCLYGLETIVMLFYRPLIFQGCNSHLIAFDIPQVPGQKIPIIHCFCHIPANIFKGSARHTTSLLNVNVSESTKQNTVSQSQTFDYSHKVWFTRSTLLLIMAGHLQKDCLTNV